MRAYNKGKINTSSVQRCIKKMFEIATGQSNDTKNKKNINILIALKYDLPQQGSLPYRGDMFGISLNNP